MQTSLEDFLAHALLYTQQEIREAAIEKIERVKLPSSSSIHNEVKVVFTHSEARDSLSSKGKLLATYTDTNSRPQAGFRMDIPEYLAPEYKLLNNYGYRMKRAHGKEI